MITAIHLDTGTRTASTAGARPTTMTTEEDSPGDSSRSRRVLRLDGDDERRSLDRFDTVVAASAEDGLSRLDGEQFDCVVAGDVPDADIVDLVGRIRDHAPQTPVVVFATDRSEHLVDDAFDAGAVGYVLKGDGGAAVLAARVDAAVEAVESTERQSERLDELGSVIRHDLRNPLSVLDGYLDLIRGSVDDEEYVDRCQDAVDKLQRLADDIGRLTEGARPVPPSERESVELGLAARDVWDDIGVDDASDAELVVETDRTVTTTEERLEGLLEGILGNALDHGGAGVTVTIGDTDDGFYVADDGPGIPADKRDQVFEREYTTIDDGTGFGLAIVSEIVDTHGWTIEVTESDAGGARFEIRLSEGATD